MTGRQNRCQAGGVQGRFFFLPARLVMRWNGQTRPVVGTGRRRGWGRPRTCVWCCRSFVESKLGIKHVERLRHDSSDPRQTAIPRPHEDDRAPFTRSRLRFENEASTIPLCWSSPSLVQRCQQLSPWLQELNKMSCLGRAAQWLTAYVPGTEAELCLTGRLCVPISGSVGLRSLRFVSRRLLRMGREHASPSRQAPLTSDDGTSSAPDLSPPPLGAWRTTRVQALGCPRCVC